MKPALSRRSHLIRDLKFSAALAASLACPAIITPQAHAQTAQPARRLTPAQGEGPFYPDQALADSDFDLLRNGNATYTQGQAAWVTGTVTDLQGKPVAGSTVEIWQCDHEGLYRHSSSAGNRVMAFQGFGRVQTGSDGRYRFRTIKPAAYPGRPPHIHFKLKLGTRELLTTQLYIQGERANARDGLLRGLRDTERSLLEAAFVKGADGWEAEFPIVVVA